MSIVDLVICYVTWAVVTLYSYMLDAFKVVLHGLFFAVNAVLWLLPHVAFDDPQMDGGVVGFLNYVLPLGALIAEFTAIMFAWILYRLYEWLLRWGKVVE